MPINYLCLQGVTTVDISGYKHYQYGATAFWCLIYWSNLDINIYFLLCMIILLSKIANLGILQKKSMHTKSSKCCNENMVSTCMYEYRVYEWVAII